jgi:pyrroloquinoline quinone (PQQ) biosynthesis protein C
MYRQETEPIFTLLDSYRTELSIHPLLVAARDRRITRPILEEFAFHQYSDSILWIPMLAQMKSKAIRSRRLRQAIEDNIAHEAGLGTTSHVELAKLMMRSLGLRRLDGCPVEVFADSASLWLSDAFAEFAEPEVAGFLLVAETLVPLMFAEVRPCYAELPAETAYFDEHVRVDADEHAAWMAHAVDDVVTLYDRDEAIAGITRGMADAWQETREVPDALWRKLCASR